jgi:hypothetical protein
VAIVVALLCSLDQHVSTFHVKHSISLWLLLNPTRRAAKLDQKKKNNSATATTTMQKFRTMVTWLEKSD